MNMRDDVMQAFFVANGVLAVVIVLLNDYCIPGHNKANMVCSSVGLTRIEVLQVLVSIEILLMGPCVIVYLGKHG